MKKSILTIAGLDPISGAGVTRDTQIFVEKGLYPLVCITSIVPQSTCGIKEVHSIPVNTILKQLEAIFEEFSPEVIKIALVPEADQYRAILDFLKERDYRFLILDPILRAGTGDQLASEEVKSVILKHILPHSIITPNLQEAEFLTGEKDPKEAAQKLVKLGFEAALIKGGHSEGELIKDLFVTQNARKEYPHKKFPQEVHGTGCSISALIASNLTLDMELEEAVGRAIQEIVTWFSSGKMKKLTCSCIFY